MTSSSARASGSSVTPFSDLELSRRLERAEGHACVDYVDSRRRIFPDSGADWIECAGAYAAFDGVDSPITQTFGLGLEELTPAALETIERFFIDRGAPVFHEVSPFAGIDAINLLCERLREAWLMLKVTSFADAEHRIRAVLTHMADQFGIKDARGTIINLKLTHKDLAHLASISRETVTRFLNSFEKNGEIEILDNKSILLKPAFLEKNHLL